MTWKELRDFIETNVTPGTENRPVHGTFGDSERPGDNQPFRIVQATFDDRGPRLVAWPLGA